MIIRSVRYAGSVARPGAACPELPQIAFSGRSNVGKSSLINTLLGRTRRRQARISATPGKTRALNFYLVNERFHLVDLPGYGYAAVPLDVRRDWASLVDWYLASGQADAVVQLIDSRREATESDLARLAFLAEAEVPVMVVLTKVDKLKARERSLLLPTTCERLDMNEEQIICFSARTGEGREDLLGALEMLVSENPRR